jgi:hypothetical protein
MVQWLVDQGDRLEAEGRFNEAALELFAFQFETNRPYGDYCRRKGQSPREVRHWTEIPALPTDAYKCEPLATFDTASAVRVFMTSGTSSGPESRGKVYKDREAMAVHDAVVRDGFRRWCLPDRERIRMLVLAPPEESVPHLRMAHDCSLFLRNFDAGSGGHFIGEDGIKEDALSQALREAEAAGSPVMLVGATFSFVRFMDGCRQRGARFALPAGSRMADGGGYKGRSRELTKPEFLSMTSEILGLPGSSCVNLLGITELTSLFFDNVMAEAYSDRDPARHKTNAPWTRTRAVHPETLALLPPGEVGLLRHWDLANVACVIALQTDDLGMQVETGFEVLGRARGAELRGCSLAMEQYLLSHGDSTRTVGG